VVRYILFVNPPSSGSSGSRAGGPRVALRPGPARLRCVRLVLRTRGGV